MFTSIYGRQKTEIDQMSKTLTKEQLFSESREEFYTKKLDKLREIQRRKWGNLN